MDELIYGASPIATKEAVSKSPPDTVDKRSPNSFPAKSFVIASTGIPTTGMDASSLKKIIINTEKVIFFRTSSVLKIVTSVFQKFFISIKAI